MTLAFLEWASSWANTATVIFGGLAAIAAALSLFFSSRLNTLKDEDFARFKLESAERIAVANSEAAKANTRAAEANEKAESEKLARLKIEEKLTPRVLDRGQRGQMIEALKPLSGTEFTASVASDAEALFLLLNLIDVFSEAGLVFRPWAAPPRLDTGYGFVGISEITTGIILHSPPPLKDKALEAWGAAFRFSGLKSVGAVVDSQNRFGGRLHIEVGKKDMML